MAARTSRLRSTMWIVQATATMTSAMATSSGQSHSSVCSIGRSMEARFPLRESTGRQSCRTLSILSQSTTHGKTQNPGNGWRGKWEANGARSTLSGKRGRQSRPHSVADGLGRGGMPKETPSSRSGDYTGSVIYSGETTLDPGFPALFSDQRNISRFSLRFSSAVRIGGCMSFYREPIHKAEMACHTRGPAGLRWTWNSHPPSHSRQTQREGSAS